MTTEPTRRAARRRAGVGKSLVARVLRLREIPEALLQKIDAKGSSFWAALQPGTSSLKLLDRLRLWLQRSAA